MDNDDHVNNNNHSLTCTYCNDTLKRCVVYPCRNFFYDDNDPEKYSHLCGLCITCGKIKEIYFVNDPRVFFPPKYISNLELYNSKNTINLENECRIDKIV